MKKVGIVTTHRQANWGSVLQCYALQEALDRLGFDAEVIDYFPEDVTLAGQLRRLRKKSSKLKNPVIYVGAIAAFTISYIKRKIVFTNYIKKNLKLSSRVFYSASEINEKTAPEDIYCCGGDQSLNGFMMLDVFDNLKDDSVKVTYSSSFGKTSFTEKEWKHEVRSLKRFDKVSCREDSGIEIMKKMKISDPQWIIDPAFLLSRNDWAKVASKKYKGQKYIMVYNLHHDKNIEAFEKKLSKKYGLPVINVCNHWFEFYRYGKVLWSPKVEDFLSLIQNAEYVISDSFHATAFSIIFHTKFISVVPETVGTRIKSVLNLFGLSERLIATGTAIRDQDEKKLMAELDCKAIDSVIARERKKAEVYIQSWNDIVK